jgi:hypothetical protein
MLIPRSRVSRVHIKCLEILGWNISGASGLNYATYSKSSSIISAFAQERVKCVPIRHLRPWKKRRVREKVSSNLAGDNTGTNPALKVEVIYTSQIRGWICSLGPFRNP